MSSSSMAVDLTFVALNPESKEEVIFNLDICPEFDVANEDDDKVTVEFEFEFFGILMPPILVTCGVESGADDEELPTFSSPI